MSKNVKKVKTSPAKTKKQPDKRTQVHTRYRLADSTIVPGATTILGILNKPALMDWAWQCGMDGIDYKVARDTAAGVGTITHEMIMKHLTGGEMDISLYAPADVAVAQSCLEKFKRWQADHEIVPMFMELPLVSEQYRFGGTPDFYGKVDNQLTILDFKTGKAIYSEYFHQVAAYAHLCFENGYYVSNIRIIRIGKEEKEGFEDREISDWSTSWRVFLKCRELYELLKEERRQK